MTWFDIVVVNQEPASHFFNNAKNSRHRVSDSCRANTTWGVGGWVGGEARREKSNSVNLSNTWAPPHRPLKIRFVAAADTLWLAEDVLLRIMCG